MGMAESPRKSRAARAIPPLALVLAITLLSVAIGAAAADHGRKRDSLDRALAAEAREQASDLHDYFNRARSLTLVTAANPAYRQFYELSGSRRERILEDGETVQAAQQGLAYLEDLRRSPRVRAAVAFVDEVVALRHADLLPAGFPFDPA